MSISGHKSLESLAIYQKVASDEKMMMGMSLMYSLLCPEEVAKLVNPTAEIPPIGSAPVNVPQPVIQQNALPAPEYICPIQPSASLVSNLPMDNPNEKQKTSTEIVPFNATDTDQNINDMDFNLSEIINEFQEMEDDNELLIQASQQAEKSVMVTKKSSSTALIKKTPPPIPTFGNCKIGNININIYKN